MAEFLAETHYKPPGTDQARISLTARSLSSFFYSASQAATCGPKEAKRSRCVFTQRRTSAAGRRQHARHVTVVAGESIDPENLPTKAPAAASRRHHASGCSVSKAMRDNCCAERKSLRRPGNLLYPPNCVCQRLSGALPRRKKWAGVKPRTGSDGAPSHRWATNEGHLICSYLPAGVLLQDRIWT